ncbi:hemin uptake protein HemP [Lysobacter sp. K5869]|uniref:hemin uptake protein HemP n=1 Tax=Lysobacter sp. K5869 TaxID=2820808 RepID=UPI001C0604BC|nr:hemin uptake protein HemP [Lysobacter sp. K5869]QWP76633.1 hemin uptake protein HemP [Lysobacter sp. K5869]
MSLRNPVLQLKPRTDRSLAAVAPPVASVAPAAAAASAIVAAAQGGLVESAALLRGAREVLIRHGGEVYRLRHTRNDKLILTK